MCATKAGGPPLSAAPPSERFGRFVLLREAGAGAMGTVYAAYDPELDRRVALKVLRGRQKAHQERIRREAMAMARVSHPNVAQIYEVGEHDGLLFIAMEFVEGITLTAWQAQVDDWTEIVRLYVAVGRGLAAAHAAGLVHRDFKPDNVLVGADGRPRVIDFGLARAPIGEALDADAALEETGELLSSPLTRTGRVLGTPAYMAPEQMAGEVPTAASDQFAFAVALYEALYDQPPFARDSLMGLRRAVSQGRIEDPPAGRAVRPIHQAMMRALSVAPGDRWPAMAELLDELERHATSEDHTGWRSRLLVVLIASIIGIGGMTIMRIFSPPETAWEVLIIEAAMFAGIALAVLWFRAAMARTLLHRHMAAWVVSVGVAKTAGAAMGVVFDQPPHVIHAFDTVTLALMAAVATFMIRRNLWPMALFAHLALVGIAIWPSAVFLLHDLVMLSFPITVFAITGLFTVQRSS